MKKPRIILLVDRKGWAFDITARSIVRYLGDRYDFMIRYVNEHPNLHEGEYDLICVFFWGETYHLKFIQDPKRIIKGVSSHRWAYDSKYGFLTPQQLVKTHLYDAGHIMTTSRRLQSILQPFRNVLYCPNGYEPERFHHNHKRKGKLKIGWAGNIRDTSKGVEDILRPACVGQYDLCLADGSLRQERMMEFYNSVDVLCIASMAEGEPLVLLEGMACGCFPVGADVGILPELVNSGYNGLIVDRSVEGFRTALSWCEQNLERVRRAGLMNASVMGQTRTWKELIPGFANLFNTVFDAYSNVHGTTGNNANTQQEEIDGVISSKQIAIDYESHFRRMNPNINTESAYLSTFNYYEAELGQILPRSRTIRVVDIGSGYGHFLRYMLELGYKDIGCVDTSTQLLEYIKKQFGSSLTFARNEDALRFLANSPEGFDLVTLIDVIEHFPLTDAQKIIEAGFGALRPGGQVIIRTPNMANILGIYSRYMDLTHHHGYTEYSMAQLLENAGFINVTVHMPDWSRHPKLAIRTRINNYLHGKLYSLHDRVRPKCFDKNLVMHAEKG